MEIRRLIHCPFMGTESKRDSVCRAGVGWGGGNTLKEEGRQIPYQLHPSISMSQSICGPILRVKIKFAANSAKKGAPVHYIKKDMAV